MQNVIKTLLLSIFTLSSFHAEAYIGPGMGVGGALAALSVVGSLLIALLALLFFPIRRAVRKLKSIKAKEQMDVNKNGKNK